VIPHALPDELADDSVKHMYLLMSSDRGGVGEEVVDQNFNLTNARRRSNSSGYSNGAKDFKTKFEFNEPEPVFEENIHGPEPDDELTKMDTSSSGGSVDGEKVVHDV
jgi:hypothetical protein